MKTKRLITFMTLLSILVTDLSAQGWLNTIKDKAVEKVKEKVEDKVVDETGKATDNVLNAKFGKKEKSANGNSTAKEQKVASESVADDTPDAVAQNQKSDFVRGSVILFEDDFAGEQMGEFPSKWDIEKEGNAEVASINGKKFCNFATSWDCLTPLMKDMKSYLPEVFTIE